MTTNFPANVTFFPFPKSSHSLIATETTFKNLLTATTPDPREHCQLDGSSLQIPLAVLYSVIFVLGLAGNVLALWVFLYVHSKKNSVRVFLINIALADLLLVICLPFRVLYHSKGNHWDMGPILCKVVGNLFYMNMYISITLLGLISVDRYLKIQRSAGGQYRLQATRWSSTVCGTIWILALASVMPMILLSEGNEESNKCFQYKLRKNAQGKAYFNLFLVAVFWFVFVCLVVSYGKIALKLLRASRDKPDLPNATRYNRTARKSFFVLFLFTICFVPYHMVRVFYVVSQISETSCFWRGVVDQANEVVLLLSALNSCLDPVMYFLLSESVRKETLRLVNNMFRRSDSGGSGSGSSVDCGRSLEEQPTASFISNLRRKITVQPSLLQI
ncbi:probable G-protein coupled receptor 34b [Salvelinus namaycush]|uniref:Probable G-protein coupled receptor 34 n=1 Tax=Salvelinus namaycush TaxID=8040 RepID=A0A8U1F768_SALNM|nr:probable G-protein coupled receptor 34b [Salvelinus namaycush]XP_038870770.1 probable G-protein coupled receptor 34b [Salvelinus namaycush]